MRVANVGRGRLDLAEVHRIELFGDEIERLRLKAGDLLIVEGNGSPSEIGRMAVWHGEIDPCVHQNHIIRARPTEAVLAAYFAYYWNSPEGSSNVSRVASSTSGLHTLSVSKIKRLPVPLPPIAEQRRIVDAIEVQLTRLDAAVSALVRAKARLKRYRAAVLKAACEGRLVPTEAELARAEGRDYEPADRLLDHISQERRVQWETEQLTKLAAQGRTPGNDLWKSRYVEPVLPGIASLSDKPEGWAVASMDQLTSTITSGSRDWSQYYGEGSGTFLMAQNVQLGRLDLSFRQSVNPPEGDRDRARSQVETNDLLVTIVGANTGNIFKVPVALPEHYVCQSVALMRPVRTEIADFVALYMTSPGNGQKQYDKYIYGAGRPHLSFDQLRMTAVLLPPIAEQARIVAEVEGRLSLIDDLEAIVSANLKRADRLRQSILKRAFEGKLVPQHPADEPASALLERIKAGRASQDKDNTPTSDGSKRPRRPSRRQPTLFDGGDGG